MKDALISFTLKAALFILIAGLIMMLITPFGSAEWYVSLFSSVIMLILVIIIRIICFVRDRRDKG